MPEYKAIRNGSTCLAKTPDGKWQVNKSGEVYCQPTTFEIALNIASTHSVAIDAVWDCADAQWVPLRYYIELRSKPIKTDIIGIPWDTR